MSNGPNEKKNMFYGCDSFSEELSNTAEAAYSKLSRGAPLSEMSVLDLTIVSVVCNRVFKHNTATDSPDSTSPFYRVKGVIKHMTTLVMDLQDITDEAHKNFNNRAKYSPEASVEQMQNFVTIMLRMMYLALENLTRVLNEIPGRPFSISSLMLLDLEASRREHNFRVRPKPVLPPKDKPPTEGDR